LKKKRVSKKHKRVAVGFYKDENGETRPVTKPKAELQRKKILRNPRKFKGVKPGKNFKAGYRVGEPAETSASKVLEFEVEQLENEHILSEVSRTLNCQPSLDSIKKTVCDRFGPAAQAVWLCKNRSHAEKMYGPGNVYSVTLPSNAVKISDLGEDGQLWLYEPERLKLKEARRLVSELEARDAEIWEQTRKLEEKMFKKHGKEANILYRRVQTLNSESKEIMRQIDVVLQKLPKKEAAKIMLEHFAASRVMVERELGGKLTETEKWARNKRLKK
jgi:hypothetical protein